MTLILNYHLDPVKRAGTPAPEHIIEPEPGIDEKVIRSPSK